MTDTGVLLNLVLILAAATGGGIMALLVKQPVIVGYLIGGIVISPFTPGPYADFDQFRFLAEIGVALLLFVLGSGMAPSRFRGLGGVVLLGGAFQVALTMALGLVFLPLLGLGLAQGVLLGAILAQSSSAVIAKILHDRRETDSTQGRIAVGISLVQDISSLPLLLVLVVFLGDETRTIPSFLITMAEVIGLGAVTYILGRIFWPRILERVGRLGSDELTLLTTLALALGGSLAVQAIGLSFALGAFLAGLVVAESPHRRAALGRVLPLRDVFAAIFFVSIGTLFNPAVLWQQTVPLLSVVGALIIGKGAISIITIRLFRYPMPVAVLAGLLLAQIGEFAFILANMGLDRGAISQSLFSLVIGAAVISILLNSLALDTTPPAISFMDRVRLLLLRRARIILRPVIKRPATAMSWVVRKSPVGAGSRKEESRSE